MVHCGTLCRAIPNGNRRAAISRPYESHVWRVHPAYNRPCRKASIMVPVRLSRFSVTGSMSSRRIQ